MARAPFGRSKTSSRLRCRCVGVFNVHVLRLVLATHLIQIELPLMGRLRELIWFQQSQNTANSFEILRILALSYRLLSAQRVIAMNTKRRWKQCGQRSMSRTVEQNNTRNKTQVNGRHVWTNDGFFIFSGRVVRFQNREKEGGKKKSECTRRATSNECELGGLSERRLFTVTQSIILDTREAGADSIVRQ